MAFTLDGALWCAALTLRTLVATQGEKGLCINDEDNLKRTILFTQMVPKWKKL